MNKIEKKSLQDGNLVIFDLKGIPLFETSIVWFVWYKSEDKYKILLKTFNTDRHRVEINLNSLKKTYPESGLGKWSLTTGQCCFMKPGFEEEFYV